MSSSAATTDSSSTSMVTSGVSSLALTPTTPSLPAASGIATDAAPGVPLSHAMHSVTIKSLVPYTLDPQAHNYTKWHTLFTMVLGRFSLLHHVEDDTTFLADIEGTKENLLVDN
jgi:hypothetical protein